VSRKSSTHSRSRAHVVYALIVFDPRAAAAAIFVLRISAARRDVVAVGRQRQHDVLQLLLLLRQLAVLLPPRVHAGDALLSVHHWLDGVGVLLQCDPLLCPPFHGYYACSMHRTRTWKKTSGSARGTRQTLSAVVAVLKVCAFLLVSMLVL
jgi:hypothetical protein